MGDWNDLQRVVRTHVHVNSVAELTSHDGWVSGCVELISKEYSGHTSKNDSSCDEFVLLVGLVGPEWCDES